MYDSYCVCAIVSGCTYMLYNFNFSITVCLAYRVHHVLQVTFLCLILIIISNPHAKLIDQWLHGTLSFLIQEMILQQVGTKPFLKSISTFCSRGARVQGAKVRNVQQWLVHHYSRPFGPESIVITLAICLPSLPSVRLSVCLNLVITLQPGVLITWRLYIVFPI